MNTELRALHSVCRAIEREWRRHDDDVEAFPDIVMAHTSDLDLSSFGELSNVMNLLGDPYVAQLQKLTTFSDAYLMLWHNGRFHVEVLNWWGSDINIHDHNFSGVQVQLVGESLNILYDFGCARRSSRLCSAPLTVRGAEIWTPGTRSRVRPGGTDPHTVHHLTFPTSSLLFRTVPTPDFGPQLNYFPPGVSGSYTVADPIFRKKVEALRNLSRGPQADFHRVFREVIASQTPTETLFTVLKMTDIVFREHHVELLHALAGESHEFRAIVEAAVFRRATEFFLETIKPRPDLTEDEVLAVSVLAGAFDEASLNTILRALQEKGRAVDLVRSLTRLSAHLPSTLRIELRKILQLFGMFGLDAVLARSPTTDHPRPRAFSC